MREHHPLGHASGPAGVGDQADVVGADGGEVSLVVRHQQGLQAEYSCGEGCFIVLKLRDPIGMVDKKSVLNWINYFISLITQIKNVPTQIISSVHGTSCTLSSNFGLRHL